MAEGRYGGQWQGLQKGLIQSQQIDGRRHTHRDRGRPRARQQCSVRGKDSATCNCQDQSRHTHIDTHIDRDRMIRTSCNSLASMATVSRVCVCVSVPGDDVRKFMCMPQILCRFHGLHSQDWLRRQVEGAVGLQVEHDVTAL